MTFDLPLEQINGAQLETLRADSVREGRQLDYKEMLPGNSDDEKREFLSDVTSFANAAGGDLIFGVRERREAAKPTGEIEDIVGLPELNVDAERLRLEALIRDGVAPRMQPVSFHEIRRDSESPCLLIRVQRSWAGLHMVTFKNLSRFYSRTSAGKYQLDVHEIRTGFVAAEMAVERLRRFKAERVTRMLALEAPIPISDGPKLVFHALPLSTSDNLWTRVCAMKQEEIALLGIGCGARQRHSFTSRGDCLRSRDSSRCRAAPFIRFCLERWGVAGLSYSMAITCTSSHRWPDIREPNNTGITKNLLDGSFGFC